MMLTFLRCLNMPAKHIQVATRLPTYRGKSERLGRGCPWSLKEEVCISDPENSFLIYEYPKRVFVT